jgi:exodeoxyribonuclease V beta subunit
MNGTDSPSLITLPANRQLRELEFTLSAGRPKLEGLVDLLKEHGAPTSAPEYYQRLAEVGSPAVQGFLRGYIDLMFEWEGRWYVADYKSNTLPRYDEENVCEAVQRQHYVLQGQLYSVAAHRHLQQRVPDYAPERHWGGALFLFVRGMRGSRSAGTSVFFDQQSASLLMAIDRWLGGDDESR